MKPVSTCFIKAIGFSLIAYSCALQADPSKDDLSEVAGMFGMSGRALATSAEPAKKETAPENKRGGIFSAEALFWSTNYSLPFAFDFNVSNSQLFSQSPTVAFQSSNVKAHFIRPSPTWTPGFRVGFGGNT